MLEKVGNVEVVSGGKMGLQVENRKHISLKDETVNESYIWLSQRLKAGKPSGALC